MLSTTLQLDIVTPDKRVLSSEVTDVVVPGTLGEFGVLPGHTPMISLVGPGIVLISGDQQILVDRGYAEVQPDRVTLLVEQAVRPDEIKLDVMETNLGKCNARIKELSEEHPDFPIFADLRDFYQMCIKTASKK
jgi:F-type H+-transporting ATPase subunit epsilon